jgi:predicted nucleic acid-binding protein
MRIAVDTNVLVYAEGVNGAVKQQMALSIIDRLRHDDLLLSLQVLGELYNVLVRKAARARTEARAVLLSWSSMFSLIDTSAAVLLAAADLSCDHQLPIWDAVIISAAAEAGCRLLLSEDLHDGFVWGGVTIVNPFAAAHHPLLQALLTE